MKTFLTVIIFAAPGLLMAETIKCNFTEPFIGIEYDPAAQTVAYSDMSGVHYVDIALVKNVANGFVIRAADHDLKLFIDTSKKGNDGMSDFIYPYEGIYNKNLYGGCYTASKPVLDENGQPRK